MKCTYIAKLNKKASAFAETPKGKFYLVFFVDLILMGFFTYVIYLFTILFADKSLAKHVSLVVLSITFVVASFFYLRAMKQNLQCLPYTYGNLYLFRKFAFLYESLIVVFLSLLLGIGSSLLTLLEIDSELIHFCLNTFLIVASCLATSTKGMIEYTQTIWDTEHKKKGDVLRDDADFIHEET